MKNETIRENEMTPAALSAQILDAERQAAEEKQQAAAEAEELLRRAEEEASACRSEAERRAAIQVREGREALSRQSEEALLAARAEAEQAAALLRKSVEGRREEAIAAILERIGV